MPRKSGYKPMPSATELPCLKERGSSRRCAGLGPGWLCVWERSLWRQCGAWFERAVKVQTGRVERLYPHPGELETRSRVSGIWCEAHFWPGWKSGSARNRGSAWWKIRNSILDLRFLRSGAGGTWVQEVLDEGEEGADLEVDTS